LNKVRKDNILLILIFGFVIEMFLIIEGTYIVVGIIFVLFSIIGVLGLWLSTLMIDFDKDGNEIRRLTEMDEK
jgi:hypothetical protein